MDWNPEGTKIATGHNDSKIRIWNTDGQLLTLLDGHSSVLISHSFNKDSTQIFLWFADGSLRFINIDELTSKTIDAHSRSIRNIQLSHDQTMVALNSNDGTGSIWNIKKGNLLEKRASFGKDIYAQSMAWNEDDQFVAYLHNNSKISVWSLTGEFQYATESNEEKVNAINWENGEPIGMWVDKTESKDSRKIYVTKDNKRLGLIPLNNNRFALLDSLNNIIQGSKNDFIRLIEGQNGFVKFYPLE